VLQLEDHAVPVAANLPDPRRALAMWVLERLAPADAVVLATTALQLGCAAKSTAIVDGMTGATRSEIEDQLPLVLGELGLRWPTPQEALKVLVDEQATLIASGTVAPFQGAQAIWGLWGYSRDPDDDPELFAQGNGQCAAYPIGPSSGYLGATRTASLMWLLTGGHGSCKPPRFQVITAIILRSGLTALLKTPTGMTRMATAAVPKTLGVTGPLVYAVLTKGPDTILLRNAQGATAYSASAVTGGASRGYCDGLNPDTLGG
jgi:hypothetical protein